MTVESRELDDRPPMLWFGDRPPGVRLGKGSEGEGSSAQQEGSVEGDWMANGLAECGESCKAWREG